MNRQRNDSRYALPDLPAKLENGAHVLAFFHNGKRICWRLLCSHCGEEWSAQPWKVVSRATGSKCPDCALGRKPAALITGDAVPSPEEVPTQSASRRIRRHRRISRAIKALEAEGYTVVAPSSKS